MAASFGEHRCFRFVAQWEQRVELREWEQRVELREQRFGAGARSCTLDLVKRGLSLPASIHACTNSGNCPARYIALILCITLVASSTRLQQLRTISLSGSTDDAPWYTPFRAPRRSRSDNRSESMSSFLFDSSDFPRTLQTTTRSATGCSRSCGHCACVPSSNATCTRGPWPRARATTAFASVGTVAFSTTFPDSFLHVATVVA
jgi:hypothetical protein